MPHTVYDRIKMEVRTCPICPINQMRLMAAENLTNYLCACASSDGYISLEFLKILKDRIDLLYLELQSGTD